MDRPHIALPAAQGHGRQADPACCHPAAAEGAAIPLPAAASSLTALLTGHVLRDGEIVLLILKPSLWWILFQSVRFAATVLLVYMMTRLPFLADRLPPRGRPAYADVALFLVVGRVTWAMLQWMARVYVLTDQRVIRMAGVFNVEIDDCPLRKVTRVELTHSVKERLCRLGSLDVYPKDSDACPACSWQTVPRPQEVHDAVVNAIHRAQNGLG